MDQLEEIIDQRQQAAIKFSTAQNLHGFNSSYGEDYGGEGD